MDAQVSVFLVYESLYAKIVRAQEGAELSILE